MATAQESFEIAQQAEAAGLFGAARCGYRRVTRMATGDLQARAQARLAALTHPTPVSAVDPAPGR